MAVGQEKGKAKGRFRLADTPAWGEADEVTHDQQAYTFHHPGSLTVRTPAPCRLGQEASGCPGQIPGLQSQFSPDSHECQDLMGQNAKSFTRFKMWKDLWVQAQNSEGWEGPEPPALLPQAAMKELSTLSGSVGGLINSSGTLPRASPIHELGLQAPGDK